MSEFFLKRGINLHTEKYKLQDELVSEKYFKIIRKAGLTMYVYQLPGRFSKKAEGPTGNMYARLPTKFWMPD
ncbi:MAG: hypothetical protein ACOYJS_05660 [Acutalibacteraceae bacterium]|jgi:hypothetical protein